MNNTVITISRQFGSGGRLIGSLLAEELGIPCYDRAIIQMVADKSGLSPSFIENAEDGSKNKFFFNLSAINYSAVGAYTQYSVPIDNQAFFVQSDVISELASKESCVIIGRCSNYVLRSKPGCIHVYVHAPEKDKLDRAVKQYGLSEDEAKEKLGKIDKGRANYYNYYTGGKWGDIREFHLAINSSLTGIEGAVKAIRALIV